MDLEVAPGASALLSSQGFTRVYHSPRGGPQRTGRSGGGGRSARALTENAARLGADGNELLPAGYDGRAGRGAVPARRLCGGNRPPQDRERISCLPWTSTMSRAHPHGD
ncbi:hypothetical protein [Cystobacter fuscus]|uniref:hypothetical protein n=1 Tax=Cystobacter fuscus TaxID=43 RepID=UPI000971540D|nr:hypothetical protein [Cystobacter fuscus]